MRSRPVPLVLVALSATIASAQDRAMPPASEQQLARAIYKEFVEIKSGYTTGATTPVAEAAARRLRAAGFPAADIFVGGPVPNKYNLVVRYRGTGRQKPILLLAHTDVVEAKREDWTMDPYTFTEKDGYFYGRGTGDDKAQAAIWIANLIRYKREGFKPDRDIIVALTADEEGGGPYSGIAWLLKNRRELIDAELCLNEGGWGEALGDTRIANDLQVSEKYVINYRLEVHNKGGHSSLPVADNAIYHLAGALDRLSRFGFPLKTNDVTRAYFRAMAGIEHGPIAADLGKVADGDTAAMTRVARASTPWNATLRTTCVATQLEGGHAKNALPQLAAANVNCRVLPEDPVDYVTQTLTRVIDDTAVTLTVEGTPMRGPASPMRDDLMQAVTTVTNQLWPGVPSVPMMVMGATDGLYLRSAGIPTYGIQGIFYDREDIRFHGRDERVKVRSFYEGQTFLYDLVKRLAGAPAAFSTTPVPSAAGSALAGRIATNDNRVAAGTLRNGVLTIRLEARSGEWHPDADSAPGIVVRAFGEEGKPLQIPGPLIRVPRGTEVHASIRNGLPDSTLVVYGLSSRGHGSPDTVQIKPGQVREVRFIADVPGTFFYRGSTTGLDATHAHGLESQLHGAFVVDGPSSLGSDRDRIFVIGLWQTTDVPGIVNRSEIARFVINGKSWPETERLAYAIGDTVRFRILNASDAVHPMHLHGFYYAVVSRGDQRADTIYGPESAQRVVTERVTPGNTFSLTWVPDRVGNWLFHCHDNFHVLRNRPFDGTPIPPEHLAHVTNHALEMMGGLIMGIEVRPRPRSVSATETDRGRRALRLVARVDSGGTETEPAYGYVLEEHGVATPATSPMLPGPMILLKRGEPVSITVMNELPEATAVHWHGIELESYYDGVAGFSGSPTRLSPAIAPRDSFVARFTPPRSGTFIYHPHADEVRQQQAGLTGAIVVVDDPARFDRAHDIVLLVTTPRRDADAAVVLINGSATPPPLTLRAGEQYRLRFINIHTFRPSMIARLMRDSTVLTWRAIAKDGMDLAPARATVRPSVQQAGNGETFDFEFTPTAPGELRFTMPAAAGALLATLPIHVR